jgi:hypothetical protein
MTVSMTSIELQVNGMPYWFCADTTDGTATELVNLASGLTISNTFSTGAVISMARGGYCENFSIQGIRLLDPQGNCAFQFPTVNLESQNADGYYPVGVKTGLNYVLQATTSATLA